MGLLCSSLTVASNSRSYSSQGLSDAGNQGSFGSLASSFSFSPSSSGSSNQHNSNPVYHGETFTKMLQLISWYRPIANVQSIVYDVYLNNAKYHWFIMVKAKLDAESDFPFLTFEITTPDMKAIVPVMQIIDLKEIAGSIKVGEYHGSLQSLCNTADSIVRTMKHYDLLSNNCQHFCNNMLKMLNLRTFETTVGPESTVAKIDLPQFDLLANVFTLIVEDGVGPYIGSFLQRLFGAPQIVQDNQQEKL